MSSGAELGVAVSQEEKELCVTIPAGHRMSGREHREDMGTSPQGKPAMPRHKRHAGEKGVGHFRPEEVSNVPVSENWVIKRNSNNLCLKMFGNSQEGIRETHILFLSRFFLVVPSGQSTSSHCACSLRPVQALVGCLLICYFTAPSILFELSKSSAVKLVGGLSFRPVKFFSPAQAYRTEMILNNGKFSQEY